VIGRLLGDRYRIEALIAQGGMARVYRARDRRLERDVAVKVLSPPYAASSEFTKRFLAEARTAASLSHPNLVHVYDSGTSDGLHYIVMELLEGYRSLRSVLAERGRLPTGEAVALTRELLAGLELVHAQGLVHADVKPGNVMIGPGPTKLIDFGIAQGVRAVSEGTTSLGSLHAMSPEQLLGEQLDAGSDLFATGVVLYQALTGRVPYPGEDPSQVADAQRARQVAPPSSLVGGVGERLDRVVMQALDPDRAVRFASAAAMSRALQLASGSDDEAAALRSDDTTRVVLPAPPHGAATVPGRRPSSVRPGRGLRLLGIVALVMLALAVVFALGQVDLLPSGTGDKRATPTPVATPTLAPGKVRVPDAFGMSEDQAEQAARGSGLRWQIRWQEVAGKEPGIYDQQPKGGAVVDRGSQLTMYAYRKPD
jgi:serine/threonine-protein kinase